MSRSAPRPPLATALLALVLALVLGVLATRAAPLSAAVAVKPRTSLTAIERQVMCVTCKIPLNVAESPQADRERAFIQKLIGEGRTEAQVKSTLVAQYGSAVLGLPSAKGFDLTVYLVPIAVVAALLGLLLVLLPKWRRRSPAPAAGSTASSPELAEADRTRLETDMARFD